MMKVSGYTTPDLLASKTPGNTTPKAQADAAKAVASASTGASAAVVLSSSRALGRDLQNTGSVVDAKKVAHMKAAIANGTFKPNADAIADKLLSNASDMLEAQPR